MSESSDNGLDRRLREALEPDTPMTRRVTGRALEAGKQKRIPALLLRAAVLGASLAVMAILLWLRGDRVPMEHAMDSEDLAVALESRVPCFEIRNVGDLVIVHSPTGQVLAMTSGGAS